MKLPVAVIVSACLIAVYCVSDIEGAVATTSASPSSEAVFTTTTGPPNDGVQYQTVAFADPVRQAKAFEDGWKRLFKQGVKWILPRVMNYSTDTGTSSACLRGLAKYIGSLTTAKVWAVQMFDATSKIPAGLFEGTFSDFGSFDQCLGIRVPSRSGKEDFRGSYCAIEARPLMPPIPKNFSMAIRRHAGPLDSIAKEILLAGGSFYYLKLRFGVCVPSSCSLEDMRGIVSRVGERSKMDIEIPQCYVAEDGVTLSAIHIAVICVLIILTALCVVGTAHEILKEAKDKKDERKTALESTMSAFSLRRNCRKLMGPGDSSSELKALHGIRSLSIAWVVLGHTYVWTNFQLLRRSINLQEVFNQLEFEVILNAWLSVEPFFFLSGLLTCYGCMQFMRKRRINIPLFIIRRYIRLVPPLLMIMGLVFFLPLVSSGPFWYERVDPELQSCRSNWWASLLFISNWFSMKSICLHPTWFLSADLQLHILSLLVLFPLYRSAKHGCFVLCILFLAASLTVAVITYLFELPPIIQIASGNFQQILDTVDEIHIRTFTHAGPYLIGMATGYIILKYKNVKLSKMAVLCGWCASFTLSVASLYGAHTWNIGHPHGPLVTSLYAALHRSAFTLGVAWVAFACVSGHAGPVNAFLASPVLAPFSRITFCIYLTQSLVIWTRRASERERMYFSNYNILYEFVGNLTVSVLLAIPLHLLVEAPVSNLDRLLFSPRAASGEPKDEAPSSLKASAVNGVSKSISSMRTSTSSIDTAVELQSVKAIHDSDHSQNNGFSPR